MNRADSFVDLTGYAACAGKIVTRQTEESETNDTTGT